MPIDRGIQQLKELLLIIEVIFLFLFSVFCIKYKRVLNNKKVVLRSFLPEGWKQIICYFLIIASLVAVLCMLLLFYKKSFIFITKRLVLVSLLWPMAVYDFKEYRIPNKLVLSGLILRVLIFLAEIVTIGFPAVFTSLISECIAAVGAAVVCLLCMLLSRGSLGMGDLKLLVMMALLLGVEGICYSMFVSVFFAFVCAIVLLISKKKGRKDHMPFAPCILAGTIVALILCGV